MLTWPTLRNLLFLESHCLSVARNTGKVVGIDNYVDVEVQYLKLVD